MSEPSITTTPSTPQLTRSSPTHSAGTASRPAWFGGLVAVVVLQILLTAPPIQAAEDYRSVAVADPYLEMRTGPGRGYPIFHVVDRGESVDIIMQRTDWYLVRADNGKEGWVDRSQMEQTLQPDGDQVSFQAGQDSGLH